MDGSWWRESINTGTLNNNNKNCVPKIGANTGMLWVMKEKAKLHSVEKKPAAGLQC
jgi:hypothetical protein